MKKNILVILFLALLLIVTKNNQQVVKATPQMDALQEAQTGLSEAPDNLGLDGDQFIVGDLSGYGSAKNSAILQNSSSHSTGTTYDPLRAIRMTNYINQQGSIWSNVDEGNFVDIQKKQTLSLWMYFGPAQHINKNDGFGDGMAFVLQNPSNGTTSFSHRGTTIGTGETLGVWGIDDNNKTSDPATIASTAIPNSWALEFDTNANNSETSGNDFDEGISGQHIAYADPASADTYARHHDLLNILNNTNYFSMNHQGIQNVTLHDGKWHHLTISWNPNTFKITYKFNDKNPDGSKGSNPITYTTDKIQATEFGGHSALSSNKLQWGFTATSGSAYEANLIAFESIPSSVEAEVSSDVSDLTQDKTITSDSTNKDVNAGDKLSVNYHLKYDSGSDKWLNNVATIKLPSNVTYTNGDNNQIVGYITYDDGSKEPLYTSEIDSSTNTLTHTIGKDLSSSSPNSATISINGTANDVTSDTKVASVRTQFESDNLITDADTPEFTIKKLKPISLKLNQSNMTVDNKQDANLTGTVSYDDASAVDNSQVTVHTNLNGKDLNSFKMSDSSNASSATSGQLNFTITTDELTQPINTLKVYVEDDDGNISSTSTVKITKKGSLSLSVSDYSFGSINQATPTGLISRKGTWNIVVSDGREEGTTDPWNLSAASTGLTNGDNAFKGGLIFKDSNGSEQTLSGESAVEIAKGYKTITGDEKTNIGQSWNSSEGIMLKTNGLNTSGNYSGTVNWTLSESI
ncbi:lectin-like domain-containing protein [Companilactobacillus alimentarius]|uniref:WxL domain-containing protein n=1 Tax=Companilactobacillus alimentarius DSM 20249 TaxID=1423720 RepID=A0A2K9HIH8_9LACO|nr:hypothetical protein [Companilactobacillus alimentarius]AUI72361.1 hypothetical protein LA20249_09270 [Companilactobacillus alimentarius DSM 20249]KRK76617.1 extracellular protein [Companilactobacillus alimentarius DSM 20249]GEO45746.1 cell surface protein [Companilactobacillus alimentarius]